VTGDRVFQIIGSIKVSMSGLTIQHGVTNDNGGGIASEANLTIDRCIITANSAASAEHVTEGAGIDNTGTLVLKNSIVSDNTITESFEFGGLGGGIHNRNFLTISDSTISGNRSGRGGGLYADKACEVSITNSTFSGNSAASFGGAIYTIQTTTNLVNDTISGNSSDGDGGGIYASDGIVGLYNVTIAGNVANADKIGTGGGAGIYNLGASVTLNNSVLSGNNHLNEGSPFISLADCAGTLASSGNNIVTAPSCTINGSHSAGPAKLGPLQDNGGATLTHALLPGSLALDAGGTCFDDLGAPLGADQRGVPRPQGAACDLGAFELEDLIFADGFEPGT
jgi:predicted outer membrane repeat protein